MNLDELTIGQLKQLQCLVAKPETCCTKPWKVGEAYIIRTVTMILTGRLEEVTAQELVLSDAAWIAETDRYFDTIKSGKLKEVEPYGDNPVIVGRGSIIDATVWTHKLPREQK